MAIKKSSVAHGKVPSIDPIWTEIRREAEAVMQSEPALGSFMYATHPQPRPARGRDLPPAGATPRPCRRRCRPHRADVPDVLTSVQRSATCSAPTSPPSTTAIRRATAISSRCCISKASTRSRRTVSPMRCGSDGRRDFALLPAEPVVAHLRVDIHPAARFGQGIMLDHATRHRGRRDGAWSATIARSCMRSRSAARGKETGDRHPEDRRQRSDRRRRQDARQHHASAMARASRPARSC